MGGIFVGQSQQKMRLDKVGLGIGGRLVGILKDSGDVFAMRVNGKVGSPDPCRTPQAQLGDAHLDIIITGVTSGNILTEVDDEEVWE